MDIVVPGVVPLRAETYAYLRVGFEWSGGWVKKESSRRVKAELVDAGVPNPFIRSGKQEWCVDGVGKGSGRDNG